MCYVNGVSEVAGLLSVLLLYCRNATSSIRNTRFDIKPGQQNEVPIYFWCLTGQLQVFTTPADPIGTPQRPRTGLGRPRRVLQNEHSATPELSTTALTPTTEPSNRRSSTQIQQQPLAKSRDLTPCELSKLLCRVRTTNGNSPSLSELPENVPLIQQHSAPQPQAVMSGGNQRPKSRFAELNFGPAEDELQGMFAQKRVALKAVDSPRSGTLHNSFGVQSQAHSRNLFEASIERDDMQ